MSVNVCVCRYTIAFLINLLTTDGKCTCHVTCCQLAQFVSEGRCMCRGNDSNTDGHMSVDGCNSIESDDGERSR